MLVMEDYWVDGATLRRLRIRRMLTQAELGRRAGLSYTTISRIESGVRKAPHFTSIEKIADVLDVKPEDFTRFGDLPSADGGPLPPLGR